MTNPFHVLKHEHRIIERGLRALDGLCLRLEWGTPLATDTLVQILDFTGNFVNRLHHGKEEKYLFPLLRRHGLEIENGPLGAIEREHEIEAALTAELDQALEGCRKGEVDAIKRFIQTAYCYVDHLVGHIRREESFLFRIAEEVLDDDELATLMADFRNADAALGADVYARYERIATELEKDWAV